MKLQKLLLAGLLLFGWTAAKAQSPEITAGMSVSVATNGAGIPVPSVSAQSLTWSVVGNPSTCTVELDSSVDNMSWSTGGAIGLQSCVNPGSSGLVNVLANYVRIHVASISGGTVNVTYRGQLVTAGVGASGTGAPVGACLPGALYTDRSTGNLYTCDNGTWALAGGSGVSSVSGTANQIASTGGLTPVLSLPATIIAPGSFVSCVDNGQFIAGSTCYATEQAAITAANGIAGTTTPQNSTAADVPSGTRLVSLLNPTITSQTSGTHVLDYRHGGLVDFMYNPLFDGLSGFWTGRQYITNWNESIGNASSGGTANIGDTLVQSNILSGTQNWNQNGYTNKTNIAPYYSQTNSWSNGQVNAGNFLANCYGNGDCIGLSGGAADFGGANAGSDQGMNPMAFSGTQGYVEYAGTSAAASAGATSVVVTPSQGQGTQGEGRPVYDITKAVTAGTITSITGSSGLNAVVGSSTTFGTSTTTTTSAGITVTGTNLTPGSVNIAVVSNAGFSVGNVICVADPASFEYSTITATPAGHITATFLQPHASGATIATGGACGYGLSIDADVWTTNGAIGFATVVQPLRQIWPYVSSSSNTAAIVWISIAGSGDSYAGQGAFPGQAHHDFPMTFAAPGTNNQSNTIPTQPLAVAFAASDSVAEALYPAYKMTYSNTQLNRFFPSQGSAGSGWTLNYNGIYNANDTFLGIANNTAITRYNDGGETGHLQPPLAFFNLVGAARYGTFFQYAPTQSVFQIGCPLAGCTAGRATTVFTVVGSTGGDKLTYDSGNQFWQLTAGNAAQTFEWDQNGVFYLPATGNARVRLQGSSSGSCDLQVTATSTAITDSCGFTATKVNGSCAPVASTTGVTSSNPTINTDQNLIQLSIPAGCLNVLAQPFDIAGSGIYSSTTASSPALTIKAKLCTVSGCGSGTVVPLFSIVTGALNTTALANATWNLNGVCVTNTAGATGNLVCHGAPGLTLDTGAALTSPDTVYADTNTATLANIDLTAALFLQFTVAQSVVGTSNSYVQQLAAIR